MARKRSTDKRDYHNRAGKRKPRQPALFEWASQDDSHVIMDALDAWLKDKPLWRDGYDFLLANGVSPQDALLTVWVSLARKERGVLKTRQEFAERMGVSRPVTYQWEDRHTYAMSGGKLTIRDLAEVLRVRRMNELVGDVDQRLYLNAKRADANSALIALFYKRSQVMKDDLTLHVMGQDEGPVQYVDVTKEELDAIREGLAAEAASGSETG
jgi:hypothetical protein